MSVNNVIALDIGEKRVGVARASVAAGLPQALNVLTNDSTFLDNLLKIIEEYEVDTIVVGLPRNMSGQETKQSGYVRQFVKEVISPLKKNIAFVDETLSTVEAQARLETYNPKVGIDSAAAVIILEDYLKTL